MSGKKISQLDPFQIAERYGGPEYGVDGSRIIAARFALEKREEFIAWLQNQAIAPEEVLAWSERMDSLHRLALRSMACLTKSAMRGQS